jgi:hypothetical protein
MSINDTDFMKIRLINTKRSISPIVVLILIKVIILTSLINLSVELIKKE